MVKLATLAKKYDEFIKERENLQFNDEISFVQLEMDLSKAYTAFIWEVEKRKVQADANVKILSSY